MTSEMSLNKSDKLAEICWKHEEISIGLERPISDIHMLKSNWCNNNGAVK